MSTFYENVKGKKTISPEAEAKVKESHEQAPGKNAGMRGGANSGAGKQPKAPKKSHKK